ncbi:MAG: type II toxin-antitoxin system RelE/ParE family toxin [Clostridiales bacterium]|nr:type II toxin-antitoxin system RelE/ParE family toxin [Clostridiales bacterium]
MKYVLDIPAIVYRDIAGIMKYISTDNKTAAKKVAAKIVGVIEKLPDNPLIGMELKKKFGVETDLRLRIVNPYTYIVLFKLEDGLIKVYRVLDGRSDYLARIGLTESIDKDDDSQ